ncbi:MAG TPA: DUF2167 domain-containing protein [Rhodanobacteraceae bacterium]|jgi:uncharacterized membrane-anchored protein|nr:DUF2167 domain-containing protein [Rhodanobacteraceae bacterium]
MPRISRLAAGIGVCLLCLTPAFAQDASTSADSVQQQIMNLHWVEGPTQVTIGSNATFNVPEGYRFLGPADTIKFMELTRNIASDDGGTVFAPDDFGWWGEFEYADVGHVADDEKIEPDKLLASLRSNQEEGNKQLRARGWATLEVVGWEQAPFYDPQTHNLSWAIDLRNSDGGTDINFNTRLLSRTGYTAATLVASPEGLQQSIGQFKQVVSGYQFIDDQTYSAYKPGDKVAKYGLAALVTGGAVAVAAKTGLWKVIVGALAAGWKFIAAAVVALFAALGKFFKRLGGRS